MGYPPHNSPASPPPPARVRFETIGESWRWFQQQMGVWIPAILIAGIAYIAASSISNLLFTGSFSGPDFSDWANPATGSKLGGYVAAMLLTYFVQYALWAGLFNLAIKQIRGQAISVGTIFDVGGVVLRVLGASFVVGLAAGVGFIFCILPGLVVFGLTMFTIPLIIDRNMGITEAISESWSTLKSDWLNASVFHLVAIIIGYIGLLGCGVGILFTLPLYFLAVSSVYRDFYLGRPADGPMEPFHYTQPPPPAPG